MLENSEIIESSNLSLRYEEYSRIWLLLKMFMESIVPLSIIVIAFGEPGTGKTSLANKIINDAASVWKNLKTVYLDPEANNCHGLFKIIQKAFNLNGYSIIEILRILEESNQKFLIVIDNAESFVNERIVQDILKVGEGFPREGLFILMLFNSEIIPIDLVVSSPLYFIRFNPYSPNEIRTILSVFLDNIRGFASDKALDAISRASGGNAKLALMILELALCFSEGQPVDERHVLEALEKISGNSFIHRLFRINDPHARAILRILSQHPQGIRLKSLFEEYNRVCVEDGIRPLKYTQLWKRIKALEKRMFLDFKVINLKEGRTGIVKARCAGGKMIL